MVRLLFVVGLLVYFLPAILGRQKRNAGAIFLCNLLLGWTVCGWIVSLIWALAAEAPYQVNTPPPQYAVPQAWLCANCRAALRRADQFCSTCGNRVNWYPG